MKKASVVLVVLAVLAFGLSRFLPWYLQVDTGKVYSVDGIALGGTDAVAYFTDEQSVKGEAGITHTYADTTWQFSSTENRDLFAADPDKYVPAYGGYCACGMAFDAKTRPSLKRGISSMGGSILTIPRTCRLVG